MTLEDFKYKVYALIEEYSDNAADMTEDEDLATKMNSVIKILREQNHYTQTKLAEDLKISRQALIKYENMELEPPVSVVRALSNIFGVSYDCIIDNHLPLELDDADKERLSVIEHSFSKLKEHEKNAVTEMARIMAKGEE